MNDNVLVTAIITTYKREIRTLLRAVKSVLNQTYKNIELIVVNDCPEDKELSQKIRDTLGQFDAENVFYIEHTCNMGVCKARNTGISASKGSYIAFLDDDDEWLPEKIEKQLACMESYEYGLVYCPFYNIVKGEKTKIICDASKTGDLLGDLLWKNCIGGASEPLILRDVFQTCGGFDEELLASNDYDMWIRIAQKYKMCFLSEPLTNRYLSGDSITVNHQKKQQGFERFMQKHIGLYINNPEALNYRYCHRASECFRNGYYSDGTKMLLKGVQIKKFSKYNVIEPIKGIIKNVLKK